MLKFFKRVKRRKSKMAAHSTTTPSISERYQAAMVLGGVGDALGYKNGNWEFCHSGELIHKELRELGGIENISVNKWMVSDDTVMHLATAEGLVEGGGKPQEEMFLKIAAKYKDSMSDMAGRAPGNTCMKGCHQLRPLLPGGYQIPFNKRGGGCGAAMRGMCIGLRYPRPEQLDDLIAVSVECGRMTHHGPVGFLGSVATALFASYAIQGKNLREWGKGLMEVADKALDYIEKTGYCAAENKLHWPYFVTQWNEYLTLRGITDGQSAPKFPVVYNILTRDAAYKSWSFSGWGGSSGHDAPMIAYDALLGCCDEASDSNQDLKGLGHPKRWAELCSRSMFHSGDSDSTGTIAGFVYGAMYGFNGVPETNYKELEYKDRMLNMAEELLKLSESDKST